MPSLRIRLGWKSLCALTAVAAGASASDVFGQQPGAVKVNPKDGLAYVWIPAGRFQMGCVPGDEECQVDEEPRHQIEISRGFWMGKTEVTIRAYQQFSKKARAQMPPKPKATPFGSLSNSSRNVMAAFDGGPGKKEERPIVNVTWGEAKALCEASGGRLPTEAEWEYAARGGQAGRKYPWGDTLTHDNANYGNVAGLDQWHYTAPVASFPANDFGLHDMIGNVWEWTSDWLDGNYYGRSPGVDPQGPETGEDRVARGGSWGFHPEWLRTSVRVRANPDNRGDDIGFRCVLAEIN